VSLVARSLVAVWSKVAPLLLTGKRRTVSPFRVVSGGTQRALTHIPSYSLMLTRQHQDKTQARSMQR